MSVFKKVCFNCGKKVDSLMNNNLCEECYIEQNPPIKEIKPINLQICNQCSRIHYNNAIYDIEDIERMLPDIARKRIVLNEGYKLNSISINNFEKDGNKLIFDIGVDCDLA